MRSKNVKEWLPFILISFLFFVLAVISIEYVGGSGDELARGNLSVYIIKNIEICLHSDSLYNINFRCF